MMNDRLCNKTKRSLYSHSINNFCFANKKGSDHMGQVLQEWTK